MLNLMAIIQSFYPVVQEKEYIAYFDLHVFFKFFSLPDDAEIILKQVILWAMIC